MRSGPPDLAGQPNRTPSPERAVVVFFYALASAWIATMLLLRHFAPAQFDELSREDGIVEWGTVWLFLLAGLVLLRRSIRDRRVFDALVGLFCLFVAGEELSWGQRLLGFTPPEQFVRGNAQAELTLHNLKVIYTIGPKWFTGPKLPLALSLAGYGLFLPFASRRVWPRRLMELVGATAPPIQYAPWFLAAIVLLRWDSGVKTGEWVEFLAGALFLISIGLAPRTFWVSLSLAVVSGIAMSQVFSALEGAREPARMSCAGAEVDALLMDITEGGVATEKLPRRALGPWKLAEWSEAGYLNLRRARQFKAAACDGAAAQDVEARRSLGLDPWAEPYRVSIERTDGDQQHVTVSSSGPNRPKLSRTGVLRRPA